MILDPTAVYQAHERRTDTILTALGCPWTPDNGCPPCMADDLANCRIADQLNKKLDP